MPSISKNKPLQIRSNTPWGKRIWTTLKEGKKKSFKNYDEAREFARKCGYSGIRINS